MDVSIEQMKVELSNRLSEKRYTHCLNVARFAKLIATKTECDPEKMYIAGLLHDVAKELGNEKILEICDKTEQYIPDFDRENPHSLHGIAGAYIAYTEFGIRDDDILRAIAYHSGRAAMTNPEKIVFLSDCIDWGYKRNLDVTCVWQCHDLNSAILTICTIMINACVEEDGEMDIRLQDSFDFIIDDLRRQNLNYSSEIQKMHEKIDVIVDSAMDLYRKSRIRLSSVTNIRDIGSYADTDEIRIKRGKLIRSAALSELTKEDAEKLKDIGVSIVIDLRTLDEIEENPDINIEDFTYYSCPIPALPKDEQVDIIQDRLKRSVSDEESAWYAAEYLRSINMEKMYQNILSGEDSITSLKKILHILISSDGKGILFHCSKGKDRTGMVALMIEYALGRSEEAVLTDYYASALPYYVTSENMALTMEENGYSAEFAEKTREVLGIGADMVSFLNRWWESYSSRESFNYYADVLGATKEDIDLLKEYYLEKN